MYLKATAFYLKCSKEDETALWHVLCSEREGELSVLVAVKMDGF